MPTFSAKNFPATENNMRFSGAGERTDYITTGQPPHGFRVEEQTCLAPCNSKIAEGSSVWFTSPELKRLSDINPGLSSTGVYGQVSMRGPTEEADGYIRISKVTKPSGNAQTRVAMGAEAQKIAQDTVFILSRSLELECLYVSSASPGSTAPDLVMQIHGETSQFEIKGTSSPSAFITLFDKSARRENVPPMLDRFVAPLGYSMFVDLVDAEREHDTSVGFSGDVGAPKSGKMPNALHIKDESILEQYHAAILDHFADGGDNYFSIHNRVASTTEIFYTGYGNNVLQAPLVPPLKELRIQTYGGPSNGATRIGMKVKFDAP